MTTSKKLRRRKRHQVTDAAGRAALASPIRQEILEHICLIGPASVRDLAARMGATTHALHYHVRHLRDVGLLIAAGTRKSGRRDEALYDAVADRLEMTVDAGEDSHETEVKAVRLLLRRAEREFAIVARTAPERLEAGDALAARARAKLSKTARKAVQRHLTAIERIFQEEFRKPPTGRAKTETFAMTIVLVPET